MTAVLYNTIQFKHFPKSLKCDLFCEKLIEMHLVCMYF